MKRSESNPTNFERPPSDASGNRRPLSRSSLSTTRPSSSTSIRPSSSASLRPPSSASSRPSSSLSTQRPTPSTSVGRPASRISQRPYSRLSQRPTTRQSSRLAPLSQKLVTQVTGLSEDNDEGKFRTSVEFVSKSLEYGAKSAPSTDMRSIDGHVRGHTRKARIHSQDSWATALENTYSKLKTQVEQNRDLDQEIQLSRLPDHLQLLVLLSLPPAKSTLDYADNLLENIRNPSELPSTLSWKDILAEEPFEGQHWEGVFGLPPGSTVEGWETKSPESTPPYSPISLDDLQDLNRSLSSLELPLSSEESSPRSPPLPEIAEAGTHLKDAYTHRRDVEELQSRQYWKNEWQSDASSTYSFSIGDASTLGPSLSRALNEYGGLEIDSLTKEPIANAPRLIHLTLTSQSSILQTFAQMATVQEHLRKFTACILAKSSQNSEASGQSLRLGDYNRRITQTLEACSDAVDSQLRLFDRWCADREAEICLARAGVGSSLIVSLLSLEKAIKDTFSQTFDVLLDVLRRIMRRSSRSQDAEAEVWMLAELPSRVAPSAATTLLLDTLLESVQEHLSMGDHVTSKALLQVFVETVEPIWALVGRWLKNGMSIQDPSDRRGNTALDDEFFIEDNELMLLDPDFWTEGCALRDGPNDAERAPKATPIFLVKISPYILGAGKAVGLLRALGLPITSEDGDRPWMSQWAPFNMVVETSSKEGRPLTSSIDDLNRLVYDELLPLCQTAQAQLAKVVVEDGDLWLHLNAIEDIYLMRRGDVMSRVADAFFAKMDSHQSWTDLHFLNNAFRDIVESSAGKWIDSSLVRLSYRGGRDKAGSRTVRAMDGLLLDYAAPFPLTYVFVPRAIQVYCSIFVFLLQIRRAKTVLERILVRGTAVGINHNANDLKAFYAIRSRLSWFVGTLLDFIATHVLHSQLLSFHAILKQAKSLDEIIRLHNDQRLLCVELSSFAGDTTHDISRQSIISMRKHRSRRLRRQRKDAIGFSQLLPDVSDNSSDDSDFDQDPLQGNSREPSFSMAASSTSFVEEDFFWSD
ncbi:hypothetical protein EW146_g6007 [Bondarzewia mesenterica]|uniref:Spindle pole body component n=1 Tax=Bondarzewia mesenterica TaxID=1095465 RepID=A0A4S4LQT3_9AGAM|nr:hypothetical protein EW146_g6007 [Bondarzewia mesenterica]